MHSLRRIILHSKNMIAVFIVVYLLKSVMCASISETKPLEEMSNTVDKKTWIISDSESQAQIFTDLIRIFERLGVLSSDFNRSTCVSLERIERKALTLTDGDDGVKSVNVILKFKQHQIKSVITSADAHSRRADADFDVYNDVINICKPRSSLSPRPGIGSLSRKQTNDTTTTELSGGNNSTGTMFAQPSADRGQRERGLSRTQIAVIATCAAVLGTLFIIVALLRVRSCLRRYRTSRELNITRRASSMGLNGSNNVSTTNVRRDSGSSKASRQSNSTFKSAGDVSLGGRPVHKSHFLAHSTSPLHNYDHKPLLPVVSMGAQSDQESSHGSLAFIDESDPHCKLKELDGPAESDADSEDGPLLRKSPDSGSFIDIPLTEDSRPQIENVTVDPENNSSREVISNGKFSKCSDVTDVVTDHVNAPTETEIIFDNVPDKTKNGHYTNNSQKSLTDNEGKVPDVVGDECLLNSIDGTKVVGFEKLKPGSELVCLARSYVVTSGLCQSDNSLSNGPSYQYGNQSEYTWGVYGNVAYCCPHDSVHNPEKHNHHGIYTHVPVVGLNDLIGLDVDREIGNDNGLSPDDVNSLDKKSPSELSCRSLSISNASSGEPLLSNACRSRTPSDGNILIYGRDNWAMDDTDDDARKEVDEPGADGNQNMCRIVSQIIPLAIYHDQNGQELRQDSSEDVVGVTI